MKKFKVALLFSGQPRFIEKAYPSIKEHLLDKYDCSVFCHYWFDDKPMKTGNWSGNLPSFTCKNDTEKIINELYKPYAYQLDKPIEDNEVQKIFFECNPSSPLTPYNMTSYYKSMYISSQLLEKSNLDFDFYVKLRYDMIIYDFPNLEDLNEDVLYYDDYHGPIPRLIPTAYFLTRNKEIIMKTLDIYNNLLNICKTALRFNDEELMHEHVTKCNIPVKLIGKQNNLQATLARD